MHTPALLIPCAAFDMGSEYVRWSEAFRTEYVRASRTLFWSTLVSLFAFWKMQMRQKEIDMQTGPFCGKLTRKIRKLDFKQFLPSSSIQIA